MNIKASVAYRFPALASRDFLIFWVGQFLSLIGTWMQSTAQPLLAYHLSGRPFDLGLIGFAQTLPTFLLALPGGVLVERWDKRKTVIAMQAIMMLQAFILAGLTLSGTVRIWHIVILSLFLGMANAIEITARQSMLIELVGREALSNAIALQATIFNLARVIGPLTVTPFLLLIGEHGEGWAFLANGLSYLFVIVGLFFVRTRYKADPLEKRGNLLDALREGVRYVARDRIVGMLILISALLGLISFPIIQQMPVLAKDVLQQIGDTEKIVAARNSMLFTAMGIGALAAALFLSINSSYRHKGRLLLVGQSLYIASILAISRSHSYPLTLLLIVILGWGLISQLATMNTLIQLQVPNGLRGRVFSIYLWALQGITPFGSLLIGAMVQQFNLSNTLLATGLVCVAVIGGIQLASPGLRKIET